MLSTKGLQQASSMRKNGLFLHGSILYYCSLKRVLIYLQGRLLEPETLHFGQGYSERVNPKCDWGRTATSRPVLTSVPVTKWAIVFVEKNRAVVQSFCKIYQQQGRLKTAPNNAQNCSKLHICSRCLRVVYNVEGTVL